MDERLEVRVKDPDRNGSSKSRLLEYIDILVRWRRFILINVLAVALLATGISFLLPNWYRSTASVLPPHEPDMLSGLGTATSMLRGLSAGRLPRMGNSFGSYNYFAILKSRNAMEAVVRKFDLVHVYDVSDSSVEKAIKELSANTSFEFQEDDNITVDVWDKDRQRAAAMANYFVELLNDISVQLGTQEARNNREFIEKRLERNRQELHSAEDSLRTYQEKSGTVVALSSEGGAVSPLAELYGMKAKKEIEVAILERSVSSDNPQLTQARMELGALERKLSAFPAIGIASLRLYRDVLIQQKIMEFLVPMYEQARVDEQKDVPVLLVLDKAVPAERKARPQRSLIVFLAVTLTLLAAVALVFLLHGAGRSGTDYGTSQAWLRRVAARAVRVYRIPPARTT